MSKKSNWFWVLLFLGGLSTFVILLVADLLNHGLIWQGLQSLKSRVNTTLPGEQRTIGDTQKTDITFLS